MSQGNGEGKILKWRLWATRSLLCSREQSKNHSAGRNTALDDSISTCKNALENITGFQEGKTSVVISISQQKGKHRDFRDKQDEEHLLQPDAFSLT